MEEQPLSEFMVNGIVSARDKQPYLQVSTERGMVAQLSMGQARRIAFDMLVMASRTEADALILRFIEKMELPGNAAGLVMQEFREYRHQIDQEEVISGDKPE